MKRVTILAFVISSAYIIFKMYHLNNWVEYLDSFIFACFLESFFRLFVDSHHSTEMNRIIAERDIYQGYVLGKKLVSTKKINLEIEKKFKELNK